MGRYDELAVHVATSGHVGIHPGPIAFTNSLPTVVFRRIADASDGVRICAITRADAPTDALADLVASLRSIVGSLDIDEWLA
ncbi:hypothetical protein ACFWP5_29630 [Streptomyces sp. NPDC058469]|uniref:hypothetical protein n=1 Tax=Streptomyces sp. NPDC058469 TaxID=3346514 RepID=UPI0036514FB3